MTEPLAAGRPDFFGKDSFTPFIGQVEDVNDPTHSGRVKVRCVGWHPKNRKNTGGDDALSTDDLPWARVGMPVTHAQQSRIGGKHGLLPGCWVMGFFMDGEEAQDPFVMNTFNFTSKTSTKDNRRDVGGKTGKLEESAEGFDKVNTSSNTRNTGRNTPDETGSDGYNNPNDPAGDNVANDSDSTCGGKAALESVASAAAKAEAKNPENPVGQVYSVTVSDGKCGSNPHAAEDIKLKLQERFPSEFNRFIYGDAVWDKFSGNSMDLNGILAQLALEICALLKISVLSLKSEQEERIYRLPLSGAIVTLPGRDPQDRIEQSERQRRESDIFHAIIGSLIDRLCSIIMALLQQQNNGGSGGQGDNNSSGDIGASPSTGIQDPGADCVTETFMNNFNAVINAAFNEATTSARTSVNSSSGNGSDLDEILNVVSSVVGFGTGMLFPLVDKYSEKTDVHNSQGDKSQDQTTREGCKPVRQYSTELGYLGAAVAIAGALSGGGSGGGGGSSLRTDPSKTAWADVKFGGMSNDTTGEIDFTVCEDGSTPKVPDEIVYDTVIPSPGTGFDYDILPIIPATPNLTPGLNTNPSGYNGVISAISLPSAEEDCAKNFINGTPNVAVVTNVGRQYHYHNLLEEEKAFPEIFIQGYNGSPTPVINRDSGEMVAVLTACNSWNANYPQAPVTIIPSKSSNGIFSDNPDYDIVLGGFFIQNTGFNYCSPEIKIWDQDMATYGNALVTPIVSDGRIVDIQIINSGTGFLRIPIVEVFETNPDCRGYGSIIYPIMNIVPKSQSKDVLDPPAIAQSIFCPGKNQENRFTSDRNAQEIASAIIREATPTIPTTVVEEVIPSTPAITTTSAEPTSFTPTTSTTIITSAPSTAGTVITTPSSTPTPTPTPSPTPTPYHPTPTPTPDSYTNSYTHTDSNTYTTT